MTRSARPLAVLAALLLAFASLFAAASPAQAHDVLTGSNPAADSTIETLPAQMTLTFSAVISAEPGASEVQVTDAAGTVLTDGAPSVQDNVLTQPLLEGAGSGTITVLWKVVSSDGHPISGQFAFTVTGAPTPTPTPTPTETTEPTPTPTATATVAPTETPEPTVAPEPTDSGDSTWLWIVFGVIALAVIAAVVYLLTSRSRREKALERRGAAPDAGASPDSQSDTSADR